MKAIQSLWNNGTEVGTGGFPNLKLHLISWALSSLTISRFFPNLHLVTDELGKHVLVDQLNLPYSSFSLEFERYKPVVRNEPWPLRKLYVYSLQSEPFLHFDGDVYLWKKLPHSILNAPLVAQNIDFNLAFYTEAYRFLALSKCKLPQGLGGLSEIFGANAGVIGGNDYLFFRELYRVAKGVLVDNDNRLEEVNLDYLGTFLEQSLFYYHAKSNGINIRYLFDFIVSEENCPSLQEFARLPHRCDYIHIMRGKSNPLLTNFLSQRIQIEYPASYDSINHYLSSLESYNIITNTNETALGYPRTKQVLEKWGVAVQSNLSEISSSLHLDENKQQVIEDIINFEQQREIFEMQATNLSQMSDYYFKINKYLSEGRYCLGERQIQLSSKICILESEWPWAMEYYKMIDEGRLDEILELTPTYFLTAVIKLFPEGGMFEYQFDGLGILLIDNLNKPTSISDLCGTVQVLLNQSEGLDESIINYLSFYLYSGIIEFVN